MHPIYQPNTTKEIIHCINFLNPSMPLTLKRKLVNWNVIVTLLVLVFVSRNLTKTLIAAKCWAICNIEPITISYKNTVRMLVHSGLKAGLQIVIITKTLFRTYCICFKKLKTELKRSAGFCLDCWSDSWEHACYCLPFLSQLT